MPARKKAEKKREREGKPSERLDSLLKRQMASKPETDSLGMALVAWPVWPSVDLLSKTHFNMLVRPPDETAKVIATVLNAMPYAKPVAPAKPSKAVLTPEEVGARAVARLMQKLSKRWPDPESDAEILAAMNDLDDDQSPKQPETRSRRPRSRAQKTSPSRARSPKGARSPNGASDARSPKRARSPNKKRIRVDESHYASPAASPKQQHFPLYELSVADPISYHAGAASPTNSTFEEDYATSPPRSPVAHSPIDVDLARTEDAAVVRKAASPLPKRKKNYDTNLRFAKFLAKNEQDRKKEEEEEEEDLFFDDEPILESAEMVQRRTAFFEANRNSENLHSNQLLSTLAAPIDSQMAYCHPDVLRAHPNAVRVPPPDRPSTPDRAANGRQKEVQHVQGEETARGDAATASRHFRKAPDLDDEATSDESRIEESHRKRLLDDIVNYSQERSVVVGEVFVYSDAAILAAIRLQRNVRRHLRLLTRAINKVKAAFRGRQQRARDTEDQRRDNAAARFLQVPARRWCRNRCRAARKLQATFRGRAARRVADEERFRKKMRNFLSTMGPTLRAWLRRRRRKKEDKTAQFLQRTWRGARVRTDYAQKVAEKKQQQFDASTFLQSVLRRRWVGQHLEVLKDQARLAEARRKAAELYWIRGAAHLSAARSAMSRESKTFGSWMTINVASSKKQRKITKSRLERRFRRAFDACDLEGTERLAYQEALALLRKFGGVATSWSTRVAEVRIAELLVAMDPQKSGQIHYDALWRVISQRRRRRCCFFGRSCFNLLFSSTSNEEATLSRPFIRKVLVRVLFKLCCLISFSGPSPRK